VNVSGLSIAGALTVAGVLLLVDFALSVALFAAAATTRVSLHRLASDGGEALVFLESLKSPASSHRISAHLVRQVSLLGAFLSLGLAGAAAGVRFPWLVGLCVSALVGVVALESVLARGVAVRNPRAALRRLAPLLRVVHALTLPVTAPAAALVRRSGAVRSTEEEREEQQEEEVEAYLQVGEREGILEADETEMVRGIVDLGDTRAREIMTPRTDIQALPSSSTVGEARAAMVAGALSKMPVYRGGIDDVVGVLHLRDLVRAWGQTSDDAPVTPYLRSALFVPESQTIDSLLTQLRAGTNIALVIDEYGGISGLVTLEDVLEEIVGEIRDEHDAEEDDVQTDPESGGWLVSGLAHVESLEEACGLEFHDRDFDTVGGFLVWLAGRVPLDGESFDHAGLRFTVMRSDGRRVYKVRVVRITLPEGHNP